MVGQAWIPRPDGPCLECSPGWYSSVSGVKEFRKESEGLTLVPNIGLPGRAWISKRPVWIPDLAQDNNFPRARSARKAGLKTGMAVPILADNEVVAVIEFFGRESRQEDKHLVQFVVAVANQVGIVIQRRRIQDQFDRFFTLSGDLFCVTGFDGRMCRVNPAWEKILGYGTEQLLARPYFELVHPNDRPGELAEFERLKAGSAIVYYEIRARSRG